MDEGGPLQFLNASWARIVPDTETSTSSTFGAWLADSAGNVTYVAPQFLDLFGIPLAVLQQHPWANWVSPPHRDRVSQAWQRCVQQGTDWDEVFTAPDPAGAEHIIVSRATPVRDSSGAVVQWVGVHLDDTQERRLRQELRELTDTLEQRVQVRTALSEDRAHQLRAMAIALTHAEQRERRRLAIELHDYLAQLLVASKLKAGQLDGQVEGRAQPLLKDLKEMLNEALRYTRTLVAELSPTILYEAGLFAAVKWLGAQMERHGLQVNVEMIGPAISAQLKEDQAVLVFQTIRELLFNVVKHAQVPTAAVRLEHVPGEYLKVTVFDRGVGFDPDKKAHRHPKSFGLLNVQERVQALGGTFTMQSAPHRGTAATFTVPIVSLNAGAGPAAGTPQAKDPHVAQHHDVRTIRVLLVDDHALVRQGLRSLIECCGELEVVGEAANGVEGVQLAAQLQPDVVIMDVQMPRMNGIEATRRIHKDHPGIRVIGISVNDDAEVAESMRLAGASAFVTKGGPSEDLYAALRAGVSAA